MGEALDGRGCELSGPRFNGQKLECGQRYKRSTAWPRPRLDAGVGEADLRGQRGPRHGRQLVREVRRVEDEAPRRAGARAGERLVVPGGLRSERPHLLAATCVPGDVEDRQAVEVGVVGYRPFPA